MLTGSSGNDILSAGAGNDRLQGGFGADDLMGGAGSDTFLFKATTESTVSITGRDTIYDFVSGDRLSSPSSTELRRLLAFRFIGTDAFHKKAGELRYDKKTSDTYVYGDVNGDGKADFAIHLDGAIALSKGYFVL
ncbi:hypothetical protein JNB71_16890 [Rhizobium herbae]|uniref:Peptidase M10 serralysin C-terminal domain-containing protein n=1 Tax=Rhizobium herbae TaxID=508661 RepID=A0ABS7HDU0_9HYPH|nr:hypothetical protein [Rhizobium herbae]MBW9064980.1 hypothetical protein [Rhizobium herbae]